jgi:hypothetical protein
MPSTDQKHSRASPHQIARPRATGRSTGVFSARQSDRGQANEARMTKPASEGGSRIHHERATSRGRAGQRCIVCRRLALRFRSLTHLDLRHQVGSAFGTGKINVMSAGPSADGARPWPPSGMEWQLHLPAANVQFRASSPWQMASRGAHEGQSSHANRQHPCPACKPICCD